MKCHKSFSSPSEMVCKSIASSILTSNSKPVIVVSFGVSNSSISLSKRLPYLCNCLKKWCFIKLFSKKYVYTYAWLSNRCDLNMVLQTWIWKQSFLSCIQYSFSHAYLGTSNSKYSILHILRNLSISHTLSVKLPEVVSNFNPSKFFKLGSILSKQENLSFSVSKSRCIAAKPNTSGSTSESRWVPHWCTLLHLISSKK